MCWVKTQNKNIVNLAHSYFIRVKEMAGGNFAVIAYFLCYPNESEYDSSQDSIIINVFNGENEAYKYINELHIALT